MKIVALLCIINLTWAGLFQKKVAKISDMSNCPEYDPKDLLMVIENITLIPDNTRKTLMSCTYRIKEDLNKMAGLIKIVQCANKDSPDSCVAFKTMKLSDMCLLLTASNTAWSNMMSKTEPQWDCPMKKGVYKIKNGYLDVDKMPFPFDSNYLWKINSKNIDVTTKRVISCTTFTLQMIPRKD